MARTRDLGLYAIVLPAWGDAIAGSYDGKDTASIVFDAIGAKAYGRELAERYGRERHIIWMLGGDRSAIYGERDYRPVFRALAAIPPARPPLPVITRAKGRPSLRHGSTRIHG